jgi:hypothetical protein
MRVMGHNAIAVAAAAVAIYLIGFLVYGLLFAQAWVAATGWSEAELQSGMSKMPIGFVIPILLAIGLSLVIRWRNKPGWMAGAEAGFWVAAFFLFPLQLYSYVYAPAGGETLLGINTLHQFATATIGGAVIGFFNK